MIIAITYYRYLTSDGQRYAMGGIETYLRQLAELLSGNSHTVYVIQVSESSFERRMEEAHVCGIPCIGSALPRQRSELYSRARSIVGTAPACVIFGADHCSVPVNPADSCRHIAIQHGVHWDLPARFSTRRALLSRGPGAKLKRRVLIRQAIKDFDNSPNRVCVDHNFLNWYRAQKGAGPSGNYAVIPNACPIPLAAEVAAARRSASGRTRIIFARRMQEYRGTRVMGEAAKNLFATEPSVRITFAGSGPDSARLREMFALEPRVTFSEYSPGQGVQVHLGFDIAVVPSLGSEGTSLSVAEAMAAGCLVIAAPVGGITNMVIDGYNGLLVPPTAEALTSCIRWAIANPHTTSRMRTAAYETASGGFNIQSWQQRWLSFLDKVSSS